MCDRYDLCAAAAGFEFMFELRGRCFIAYLACWSFDSEIYLRGGHTLRFHCGKIHSAFCRTPLNCDALTLAHS